MLDKSVFLLAYDMFFDHEVILHFENVVHGFVLLQYQLF